MDPLRVVIVDDSALFRAMLRNALHEIPGCEVIASVADGRSAVDKITELAPDLVTLDVEMPELSGIEVLRELKRRRVQPHIVMVSRLTIAGAQITTDALIEGAFDFILKPSGGNPGENQTALIRALETRVQAVRESQSATESTDNYQPTLDEGSPKRIDAVVIGCSTGGPDALSQVIPQFHPNFPVPIFVVQHMPERYTATLAARLDEASEIVVREADEGMRVVPNQVILARGGRHLELERHGSGVQVRLSETPHQHGCRPAVDVTLRSAVEIYGGHLLTVILTGMGRDGTAGCQLVRSLGGQVIAQHADGCVVYGMPKAVIKAGAADRIVKLSNITTTIERLARSSAR